MSSNQEKSDYVDAEKVEYAEQAVEVPPSTDDDFKFTFGKFLAIVSFQVGYMADVFSISMVGGTLLYIDEDIGPSKNYTWMVNSQVVVLACLCPIVGRLSDIFGRKRFLILGNCLGLIGGVMGATAKTVNVVIGASAFIGAASAMHQLSWSCLAEVVPKRDRSIALSLFQASLVPASAFSSAIGYALVAHASWRYAFWIPFALNVVGLVLVIFFYHPMHQYIKEEGKSRWDQFKKQDFIGFLLCAAGLVLFLLGLSFGGNQHPWVSAGTLVPLIVGALLIVALGVYEAKVDQAYPLFPPQIFRNIRGFTVIIAVVGLIGMLYYSASILWPQQVIRLYTTTLWKIGWYTSALGLGGTVFAPIAGLVFRRLGHARLQFSFDVLALTVLTGCMAVVDPNSHISSTVIVVLIGGFIGAATVISATMVQLGVAHEYLGIATALIVTARAVGGAITTTIYTAILTNYVSGHIGVDIATSLAHSGVPLADIPAVTLALATGEASSPAYATVSQAALLAAEYAIKVTFGKAFRLVYLVSITFGVLGLACAVCAANVDHLMTRQVDIHLKEGIHVHAVKDDEIHGGGGHVLHADGKITNE